jgi:cysteinyl-tRNA synthetase
MEQAVARCERLRNFFRESPGEGEPAGERLERFRAALADDFNTPRALAEAFELIGEANRDDVPGAAAELRSMLELIGLESLAETDEAADDEAEALLAEREAARAAKDFGRADEIRDRLAGLGWEVRDSAEGARLVRKA